MAVAKPVEKKTPQPIKRQLDSSLSISSLSDAGAPDQDKPIVNAETTKVAAVKANDVKES